MITIKQVDNILKIHTKSASVKINGDKLYGEIITKNDDKYIFIRPISYIKNLCSKHSTLINNPDTSKIMIQKMFLIVMVTNYIKDLNIKL